MTAFRAIALGLLVLATPAAAQEDMAILYKRAMELYRVGDFEAALPRFEKALTIAEERYGEDSPLLSLELNNLGEVYRLLGQYENAEPLFKRAIALDEETREADDPGLATSLNNLALLYRSQARFNEAEPLYKRSLSLLQRMLGPRHPDVAKSLNNLAILYSEEGRPDDARPLLERAVEVAATSLGPAHPTTAVFERNLKALPVAGGSASRTRVAAVPADPDPAPAAIAPAAGPVIAAVPRMRPRASASRAAPSYRATSAPAEPAASRERRVAAVAPGSATTPTERGSFAVHIASIRAAGDVPGEWRQLTAEYPQLRKLGLQPPQAIVLPGQGVFYRVAAGPLPDRGVAQKLCDGLKRQGQYCAVIPR